MKLKFAILIALFASCGTGPHAPPEVPKNSSKQFVIPGCKNVHPRARSTVFNVNFYLTTWGSALGEGATVGLIEGVGLKPSGAGTLVAATLANSTRLGNDELISRRGVVEEFCILVSASESRVRKAQLTAFRELQQLGYSLRSAKSKQGYVRTGFKKRGHRAADWYDRYSSFTFPIDSATTGVFVLREVYISRHNSPFIQGKSVGANEAALLTRIRDLALVSGSN